MSIHATSNIVDQPDENQADDDATEPVLVNSTTTLFGLPFVWVPCQWELYEPE